MRIDSSIYFFVFISIFFLTCYSSRGGKIIISWYDILTALMPVAYSENFSAIRISTRMVNSVQMLQPLFAMDGKFEETFVENS